MVNYLIPIEDRNTGTVLINPDHIVLITPYGTGTKVVTYEDFGKHYSVPEKVTYNINSEVNEIIKKVNLEVQLYKFGHQSFVNIGHILASNELLIKHRAGYSFVDPIFAFKFAKLPKLNTKIKILDNGIRGNKFSVNRLFS
jgi:hypothetical protein